MLQIYKDRKDFDSRKNTKTNGVTEAYLIDENMTLEEAEASMIDCEGCFNCHDCTMCIDCSYCKQCTNCTGCYMCEKCKDCEHCKRCTECEGCSYDVCVKNAFTVRNKKVRRVRKL